MVVETQQVRQISCVVGDIQICVEIQLSSPKVVANIQKPIYQVHQPHKSVMTSTSDLRQRIERTIRAFISAFEEGTAQQDASIINRHVTDDCTRQLQPASVTAAFGLPEGFAFDNATFERAFAKDLTALRFESNVISDLVIDVEGHTAAFSSVAKVRPNKGEAFDYAQAWFLTFTEDGSKVKKVVEFCDKDGLMRMAAASA